MRGPVGKRVPLRIRRPLGRGAYRIAAGMRRVERHGRSRILDRLGGLPFLRTRDLVYDDSFYDRVDPGSAELYTRIAAALVDLWAPQSVVDVGCGTGLVLEKLAARGVEVRGVEGSRAAIARSPVADRIVRANLERGVPQLGTVDLCLCIEVAEHLHPRSAERLVEGLTRLGRVVVFTAAQPGQPGTAHLNCRPRSYWRSLFAHHGFEASPQEAALAAAISGVAEPRYIHSNLMVFERAG